MDVFNLLSYLNKISLLAFFTTTVVVGYQIYVLKREKSKEKSPAIPDFKEFNNPNLVVNYTSLPTSLTNKELKRVNYSQFAFLIISLLTVITVFFVVFIIRKNRDTNQALNIVPTILPTITPTISQIPDLVTPTLSEKIVPMVESVPTAEPTEIIVAASPSLTAEMVTAPTTLPETGILGKGLLILGVAISTIFLSFWF